MGLVTGDVIFPLLFVLNLPSNPQLPTQNSSSPGLLSCWLMNDSKGGEANPAGVVTAPAATCIIDAARDFVVAVVPLAFPRLLLVSRVKAPFNNVAAPAPCHDVAATCADPDPAPSVAETVDVPSPSLSPQNQHPYHVYSVPTPLSTS